MQELLGFPAVTAGLWNTPRGLTTMAFMPIAGILISRRWDMRRLLTFGILTGAVGMVMLSFLSLEAGPLSFVLPQVVIGLGLSFTFPPLATITVDPIPAEQMGYATSIIALMRNIGGGVGISAVTTLLARHEQIHRAILARDVNPYNALASGYLGRLSRLLISQGEGLAGARTGAIGILSGLVNRQAAALSYMDAFRLLALLFVVVVPLIWIMRRAQSDAHSA